VFNKAGGFRGIFGDETRGGFKRVVKIRGLVSER